MQINNVRASPRSRVYLRWSLKPGQLDLEFYLGLVLVCQSWYIVGGLKIFHSIMCQEDNPVLLANQVEQPHTGRQPLHQCNLVPKQRIEISDFSFVLDDRLAEISDICRHFLEKFVMLIIYYYKIKLIILQLQKA